MIRIYQIRVGLDEDKQVIAKRIVEKLKINEQELISYKLVKKTLDARKKHMCYSMIVDCKLKNESKVLKRKNKDVILAPNESYVLPESGNKELKNRPVVVGFGPAGMFAALMLARQGYAPLVIERGKCVEERSDDVKRFFESGILDEESNVQYGEGGAGSFSDGKLTSRSKDIRGNKVLETLVEFGAPEDILYEAYPHIGTDLLVEVVRNIRNEIIALNGEIRFSTKLEAINIQDNQITSIIANQEEIACEVLVLAIGNSARDTYRMLDQARVALACKDFAIGIRIEHPQRFINECQYHEYVDGYNLPPANYFLKTQVNNRGVYSFCMCPGGYVIAATSKKEAVVVNGMSYHDRGNVNANAALLVQMFKEEFDDDYLKALTFIEELEHKAYILGGKNYQAPIQLVKDFMNHEASKQIGSIKPTYPIGVTPCNLHDLLPKEVCDCLIEALKIFDTKMIGYKMDDAIMSAIETRSSSCIRILRDKLSYESINVKGLYPCGEGAGYSGGIVSSAIDGIKISEAIIGLYQAIND